jgi:hypothetical protein
VPTFLAKRLLSSAIVSSVAFWFTTMSSSICDLLRDGPWLSLRLKAT